MWEWWGGVHKVSQGNEKGQKASKRAGQCYWLGHGVCQRAFIRVLFLYFQRNWQRFYPSWWLHFKEVAFRSLRKIPLWCRCRRYIYIFFFFFFFLLQSVACGILVSQPGIKLHPLQWKGRVNHGLPGSPDIFSFKQWFQKGGSGANLQGVSWNKEWILLAASELFQIGIQGEAGLSQRHGLRLPEAVLKLVQVSQDRDQDGATWSESF